MAPAAYLPFVVQAVLAAALAGGVIAISALCGQRARHTRIKDSAYECGVRPEGAVRARFSVKFYLTALLFMLFDLEVVILVPWVFVYREFLHAHLPILGPILFFILVIALGLAYEIRKGALEWER